MLTPTPPKVLTELKKFFAKADTKKSVAYAGCILKQCCCQKPESSSKCQVKLTSRTGPSEYKITRDAGQTPLLCRKSLWEIVDSHRDGANCVMYWSVPGWKFVEEQPEWEKAVGPAKGRSGQRVYAPGGKAVKGGRGGLPVLGPPIGCSAPRSDAGTEVALSSCRSFSFRLCGSCICTNARVTALDGQLQHRSSSLEGSG